jgi:lipoate-protein ligase A
MTQQWRFLNSGSGEAAMNMALDEAILLQHDAADTPPTLRVYAWERPTLSLGYAQHTAQEVDLDACRRYGVQIIRRPTGGRAVLHDDEVTYSVVMPRHLSHGPGTLTEHYRRIGLALATALRQCGLSVRLERPQRLTTARRAPTSPACFAALSRYELSVRGKKLVGSAQKHAQYALLQHGSIPLTLDRQRLFDCLRIPPQQRVGLVQEAYDTMTAIHEVATRPVCTSALHEAYVPVLPRPSAWSWLPGSFSRLSGIWRSGCGPRNMPPRPGTSTAPRCGVERNFAPEPAPHSGKSSRERAHLVIVPFVLTPTPTCQRQSRRE